MMKQKYKYADISQRPHTDTVLEKLPVEVKNWAESLPWNQRRYCPSATHCVHLLPSCKQNF